MHRGTGKSVGTKSCNALNERTPILPLCAFGNTLFCHMLLRPQVKIDTGENYPKQTWRNRYDITGPHGMMPLTVPVLGQQGQKIPVREIVIDPKQRWQALHLKTIRAAYGSSPWFEHFAPELESVYHTPFEKLADFNLASLELIRRWMRVPSEIEISPEYVQADNTQLDLRPFFKPVHFNKLQFHAPHYIQVFADRYDFVPHCSALDLIFNLGPEVLGYLQNCRFEESQITILDR